MKILILNWRDLKNPKSGGAEIVTHEHAKAWVKAGHAVTWLTSHFSGAAAKETIDGITILRKGNNISIYFIAPFYYLLKRNQYDLLIDEIHGLPFFTPLYSRKPKIALIHEVAGEIWDYMYPFPLNVIGKLSEKFYFLFYKNVQFWTDAPSTIDDLQKQGIKKENCIAIPCPAKTTPLLHLPLKEKVPTFIFVSRLVKMKGIENVISAFDFIHKKEKNAKLWIVGGGDAQYELYLKRLVSEQGLEKQIVFFGRVSEEKKISLMQKAHILLHASIKEGWGLVVLEAASQATPSIVYNVAGLRDSVINDRTGIILKVNEPQSLAKQALLLLADTKRYHTFQKNCLHWTSELQWEKVVRQSLNLIKSTIE